MYVKTSFLVLSALLLCPLSAHARQLTTESRENSAMSSGRPGSIRGADTASGRNRLSSSLVSRRFYEIAYDLAGNRDVKGPELRQAIAFLTATMELDSSDRQAQALLIELACRDPQRDYSTLVHALLVDYADEFADLDVAEKAVSYLLERMNSREQREQFFEKLLADLDTGNAILNSRLATMLGTLKAEKADIRAAQFYFLQAYQTNRYNRAAFNGLAAIAPDQISPAVSLERLRLALRENPTDIEAAIAFAGHAEKLGLYEVAAAAYEYCANLFRYLYESRAVPAQIYLPWAISCYNSRADHGKCLDIAKRVRQESGFDLRVEAIAGKAAVKMGNVELAARIFSVAEENAKQLLAGRGSDAGTGSPGQSKPASSRQTHLEQLAWFYCFALPLRKKAVPPANEAWSADPNSPTAASLLAYALASSGDTEFASPLVNNELYEHNQIADVTRAVIQLAEGKKDQAIETLTAAIARDPGSFAAEKAKELLLENGREYVPPIDANTVLASLESAFGRTLAPKFMPPEQVISGKLDLQGDTFPYGTEFTGVVTIANNSTEPFIVSDQGLFKGNIRIDAQITGDLNRNIPNLVFTRSRTTFLAAPGRGIPIPVMLMTGELRDTLSAHPQASLDIEFTLYLDPVVTESGTIANRLAYVEPARVRIRRPGARLTRGRDLRDRFTSISTDTAEKKIRTAQLFIGLLKEQQEHSEGRIPYTFMGAAWVAPLLREALLHESGLLLNQADAEWIVKVYTMAEMLSLPLDYKLTGAVAENLNATEWPVRMMAMYLLARNSDGAFDKVLQSIGGKDPNRSVRDMAVALPKATTSARLP